MWMEIQTGMTSMLWSHFTHFTQGI